MYLRQKLGVERTFFVDAPIEHTANSSKEALHAALVEVRRTASRCSAKDTLMLDSWCSGSSSVGCQMPLCLCSQPLE